VPDVAVLDANVLYPIGLCDLLLRLARRGLYQARWSEAILDEALRNLIAARPDAAHLERRFHQMRVHFAEAMVGQREIELLLPAVPAGIDRKDHHVVAAAIAGRANVIVTRDRGGFPEASLARLGLAAQSPDDFLVRQWWLDPELVASILRERAAELRSPPMSVADTLAALERQGIRAFVALARESKLLD
jgi:predicted nucleic acid-binding protein